MIKFKHNQRVRALRDFISKKEKYSYKKGDIFIVELAFGAIIFLVGRESYTYNPKNFELVENND